MKLKIMSAVGVFGIALIMSPAGEAAPINGVVFQHAQSSEAGPVTEVRRRHRYYGHRHYHDNDGGAFAAGAIFGLATGAILGNAAANNRSVGYCAQRFRSYDPASGTYLGYDGYRHPCP